MKKQIVISTFIGALIWGTTALMVLNTASAKESTSSNELLANNSTLTTKTPITTKNETVYVTSDENGNEKAKFIGSTLYNGSEELPFNFSISYYLDGQEISTKDLSGKTGHVKIVYHYAPVARYQGKYVPFLAITNLVLNHSKFSNIKLDNGKLIHETPDNYIVTGFSITGGNANLGVDFLPETFTFEADVTDFKLEDSYTVFTNDLIADIDLSMLTDLDSVVNSIYQLSDGLDKIINGSNELANGLGTALEGTKSLYEGSKTLSAGAKDAADGASELSTVLGTITDNNEDLQNAAKSIIGNICKNSDGNPIPTDQCITNISQRIKQLKDNPVPEDDPRYQEYYGNLAQLTQSENLIKFALGVIDYTNGVSQVSAGATKLSAGLTKISVGANSLSEGLGALVEGQTKLYQGAVTLRDGLATFKASGIDKLVNFATNDLARFTNNLRATVRAAASYKNFGGVDAKTVKFIVKTPSI